MIYDRGNAGRGTLSHRLPNVIVVRLETHGHRTPTPIFQPIEAARMSVDSMYRCLQRPFPSAGRDMTSLALAVTLIGPEAVQGKTWHML